MPKSECLKKHEIESTKVSVIMASSFFRRSCFVILRALGLALYAVFFVGLLLHTSSQPAVFGKYSWGYALLLVAAAGGGVAFIWLLRFLTRTTPIALPSGRTFRFSPVRKLLVYGAIAVVALVPVEVYLRSHADVLPTVLDQYHPFLGQRPIAPDPKLHVNAHGFRGDELVVPKPPGTFRIFFLGGSTVFCETDPFEKTHARLLERLLQEQYPDRKIELQNAGYPWYTSQQSLMNYLFKIKDFEPDLILVWHGINDLCRSFEQEDLTYGSYQPDYSNYLGPTARMAKHYANVRAKPRPLVTAHSYTIGTIAGVFRGVLYSDLGQAPPVEGDVPLGRFLSLPAFRRNMTSLAAHAQLDGVRIVLATQPTLYRDDLSDEERKKIAFPRMFCVEGGVYPDLASMIRAMDAYNDHVRAIAAEHGVPLVNLDRLIPKQGEYFFDDCHFTETGNARVAQEMFRALVEQGVIE
jgi:lysophospholipase L1-like esterase